MNRHRAWQHAGSFPINAGDGIGNLGIARRAVRVPGRAAAGAPRGGYVIILGVPS